MVVTLESALKKMSENAKQKEKQVQRESQTLTNLKLKKIYIEIHKMFQDFTLDFMNNDESSGYLMVLAGLNGTGKTTLLEFINTFVEYISENRTSKSFVEIEYSNREGHIQHAILNAEALFLKDYVAGVEHVYESAIARLYRTITYIPATTENIDEIEIADYYIKLAEKLDSFKKALNEIQSFITNIFSTLNLSFTPSRIDYKNKKVFFKNEAGEEFEINSLSTGEKTLLSKVLHLYMDEIKDTVILIDEPELSLHPSWQNRILSLYENFAKEKNCQIILATHSPHIIGSAKNEYIRLLTFNDEKQIEVIDELTSYGRDIAWVLEEVMGAEYTREKAIVSQLKEIEKLLDDEKYETAEESIDALESLIGTHDNELIRLRTVLEFEKN